MDKQVNQVFVIEKKDAADAFSSGEALEKILVKIENHVRQFKGDASTEEGRKEISSIAYKVARSKTALDDYGKSLTDEWRQKTQAVNAQRNIAKERLDALKEEVRRPLTEYEEVEEKRKKFFEDRITEIVGMADFDSTPTSDLVQQRLDKLPELRLDNWDEFEDWAKRATKETEQLLTKMLAERIQSEKDAAELAQLRLEKAKAEEEARKLQAEKEQREREDKIRQEAEQRAKQELETETRKLAQERERVRQEAERQQIENERLAAIAKAKYEATELMLKQTSEAISVVLQIETQKAFILAQAIADDKIPNVSFVV